MNRLASLLTMFLILAPQARAAPPVEPVEPVEPSLELGVGVVILSVPDYRGSDRSSVQAYPFPYAVYHSEHVQLSRGGLRARIFSLDRLSLSVSAALNLTSRRYNPDRAGMPRLAPTLEVGPSLDYRIEEGEHWSLRARLPVRGAVSSGGFKWVGLVLAPQLRLDLDQPLARSEMGYTATVGALAASGEYHQYYYGVAPQYAAGPRTAYEASGGYGGTHVSLSAVWRVGRWNLGGFVSNDWLDGVAFADSPLVKTHDNVSGGVLLTYRLYSSSGGGTRDDDSL